MSISPPSPGSDKSPRRPDRDDLLEAIRGALAARNMPAVAAFLHALAVVSPDDATLVLVAIDLAAGA